LVCLAEVDIMRSISTARAAQKEPFKHSASLCFFVPSQHLGSTTKAVRNRSDLEPTETASIFRYTKTN